MKLAFLRTDEFSTLVSDPRGGSFSHVEGFVRALKHLGHEVIFVASAPPIPSAGKEFPLTVVDHPRFFEILPEMNRVFYNWNIVRIALPKLKKEKPDVLYQRHSDFTISGVILSRLLKIPLILEANNSEVWMQSNWGKLTLKRLCALCERISFRGTSGITVVSNILKTQLAEYGADPDKIIVNPNGVDPEEFTPSISGSQIRERYKLEDTTLIGFLGTFGPWHGAEVLARSAATVLQGHSRAHFIFIGDGVLRVATENIIKNTGASRHAIFTGSIPHDMTPQYLAACDILVSPHVPLAGGYDFFGSPTKLFEYMAMGKAIVASRIGQIREILKDSDNSLLVEPGSSDHLAQAILSLCKNIGLRDALGFKARQTVLENYTWEHNARRVLSMVERLKAIVENRYFSKIQ